MFDDIRLGISSGLPEGHPIRDAAERSLVEVERALKEIEEKTFDPWAIRIARKVLDE